MSEEIKEIIKNIQEKITIEGKKRVFEDDKELKSDDLKQWQDPEEFTRDFLNAKQFPIKIVNKDEQKPFIELVDNMLELTDRLNRINNERIDEKKKIEKELVQTDTKIDQLVYRLYGLTEKEISIIENT